MNAAIAYEIMNPELYAISPERPAHTVIEDLLSRGITSAPVVDRAGYPLGVLSLRDLVRAGPSDTRAGELMSAPAVVIEAGATVDSVARLLSSTNLHRVIVIDELGRAIGVVAALDVVRGLSGEPATHPWPFVFRERNGALAWSQATALELERVRVQAPAAAGVFVLLSQVAERPYTVVWAEASNDVRARLEELFHRPQPEPLASALSRGSLLFRCVETPFRAAREAALRTRG